MNKNQITWGPISAVVGAVLAYFIPYLVFGTVLENNESASLQTIEDTPWAMFAVQAALAVATLLFVMAIVSGSGGRLKSFGLNFKNPKDVIKKTLIVFAVYFALTVAIATIMSLFVPDNILDQNQDLGFSQALSGLELLPVFLALVFIAPITEEVLFRGFMFNGLRSKLSFWPAAVISSGIFAAAHWQLNVGIDVFIMSLGLAWLYENTKTLWSPILLHMLKNAIAFVLVFVVVT